MHLGSVSVVSHNRLCHFLYLPLAHYDNRKFYYATIMYFHLTNAEVRKGPMEQIHCFILSWDWDGTK